MPKPGYGAITIPLTLKEQLTAMAKASNQSVPKLLEQLITDLRSSGVGLRGFKSRPPHHCFFEKELETGFSTLACNPTLVQYPQHRVQYAIDYWSVKDDFIAWLRSRGLSWERYVRQMLRTLEKFSRPVRKPMDVVVMFSGLNGSQKRCLVNGLRSLFRFYEVQGYAEKRWLDLLRSNLPKTSVGVDLRVPSEKEIVESLKRIAERDAGRRYFGLYNLLLDSGLRLTEAVRLFDALRSGGVKLEKRDGFCIAPLGYFRGTKLAYFGFLTEFTLKVIERSEGKPLGYKKVMGTATKRFGVVSYKYLRKFAFDNMTSEKLNIPESVADFIQGRTPKSIGARHYMKLKRKAVKFYPRYAKYVAELRRKAGIFAV